MKVFQNKNLFKKLIIMFLFITIFSFCLPKSVRADDGVGGLLLKPVIDLLLGVGDGALDVVHKVIYHQDQSVISVDMTSKWWEIFSTIAVGIIVAVVVAAAVIATAGAVAAAVAAVAGITLSQIGIGTILLVSIGSGVAAATVYNSNVLPDDLKLPIYMISPEEIFSNKILLFDVDFFNPSDGQVIDNTTTKTIKEDDYTVQIGDYVKERLKKEYLYSETAAKKETFNESNGLSGSPDSYVMDTWDYNGKTYAYSHNNDNGYWLCIRYDTGTKGKNYEWLKFDESDTGYGKKLEWDNNAAGAIWSDNKTTVNMEGEEKTVTEGEKYELESTAKQLRSTVSNWYRILRDIAIVALLSVLVYSGIRIIISSTASDKAKYKQLLLDWLVALCLLFLMQYIMSFSNIFVDKLTELVNSSTQAEDYYELIEDKDGKIEDALTDASIDVSNMKTTSDGTNYIQWKTNLLGLVRLQAQMATDSTATYAGYAVIFIILVLFTIYFIFTYLKRVLYMAFLTIIAPMVALTYPIDKMNDGKAQAFDMWFKEYIFNLLIQPLHLLLYTILVTSALELARTNIIYSVVAIAFMIPAEKLMRKFFGFEKAHTPGFLAGPAGAALTMSGLNKLMGHRPPKPGDAGNTKSGGKEEIDSKEPRYDNNFDKQNAMIGDGDNPNNPISTSEREENGQGANAVNNIGNAAENNSMLQRGEQQDRNVGGNNSEGIGNGENQPWVGPLNEPMPNSPTKKESKAKKAIKGYGRGMLAAGRAYKLDSKNRLKRSLRNMHPLRTASKVAMGAAGAAAFGLAAGTIGLATGDPTKAFQFASTGLLGGYKFGSSAADSFAASLEPTIDINEEYKRGYYGSDDEYKKAEQKEYIKNMKNDASNILKLEHEFGHKEAKEIIKNGVIDDYAEDGIYDMDDIIAGYKLEKEDSSVSREQAKSAVEYSKRIGQDTAKMKKDDIDKWEKTFSSEFADNDRVRTQNLNPESLGHKTMETVKKFNKFKYEV